MSVRRRLAAAGRTTFLVAVAAACHTAPHPARTSQLSRPSLELDHIWVVCEPGAPERAALAAAGLRVDTAVNRHDGQGTASVIAELEGGFLELLWPDSSVRVAAGREAAVTKFERRRRWRSSGWSPFGIGLRRTRGAPDSLPYATWAVRADYMRAGDALLMLTPVTDTAAPSVWVVPRSTAVAVGSPEADRLRHPNGARRITGLELVVPIRAADSPAVRVLRDEGVATVRTGAEWLLRVTLDHGVKGVTRDLRPALPVILRF